jgi:hypothetical protein
MSEKKERPPVGDSWIDYATRHQHAGARPCWQCKARELALAEYEAAQERVRALERERDELISGGKAVGVENAQLKAKNAKLQIATHNARREALEDAAKRAWKYIVGEANDYICPHIEADGAEWNGALCSRCLADAIRAGKDGEDRR